MIDVRTVSVEWKSGKVIRFAGSWDSETPENLRYWVCLDDCWDCLGYESYEQAAAVLSKPEGYQIQGVYLKHPEYVEVGTLVYAPGYKPADGCCFIPWVVYIADLIVKGVCTSEFPHIPILEGARDTRGCNGNNKYAFEDGDVK